MIFIRVELPASLCLLATCPRTLTVEVEAPATVTGLVSELERLYPALRGTIRDHTTQQRRPYLRFFAEEQDLSHQPLDTPLPASVQDGRHAFIILGAISGG